MTKKRNIIIAAVFAIAVGSAFTNKMMKPRFVGPYQKTLTGCPSITSPCTLPNGMVCSSIFLDEHCTMQAFRSAD